MDSYSFSNTDLLQQENFSLQTNDSQQVSLSQPVLTHAANELSNIVSIMNGSLKYIEMMHPEVRCYKYWLDVCADALRMKDILNSLIGYHQSMSLSCKRTDLQKLLRGVYLSCLPLTEGTQKTLTFTSDTNGPCFLMDPYKMRDVFINLIKNAIEATDNSGKIQILLSKDSKRAIVQIKDNGCGISAEHLLTIFDPFVAYQPGGTGLGLSIARRVIDAHHGSIIVTSAPGKGSTFTISLPLNPPMHPADLTET